MAGPLADFVVSLNTDGHVVSQGSVGDAIANDSELLGELQHEEEAIQMDEIEQVITRKPIQEEKGKLVVAEEIALGQVGWQACEHS